MIQITPVGVATENIQASINFYRRTLGIGKIQNLGPQYGMQVLRLESPEINIESVEINSFDRQIRQFRRHNQQLTLVCDVRKTLARLEEEGIQVTIDQNQYSFTDINGLTWHLADKDLRQSCLNS